jgi:hypothetical protein
VESGGRGMLDGCVLTLECRPMVSSLSRSRSRSLYACHKAKQRVGISTRRHCWATSAKRRCHPQEALYLPTFSHLFDCQ